MLKSHADSNIKTGQSNTIVTYFGPVFVFEIFF